MVLSPKYLYFLVNVVLFIVWIILFYRRKDLRRENLSVSFLVGTLTFLFAPLFLGNYWSPQTIFGSRFSLEDFLFGFLTAGISATIYEEMFGRHFSRKRDRRKHWAMLAFPLIGLNLGALLFQVYIWGINPIYAHISSLLLLAAIFVLFRKDLFLDSIASGILFGTLYFVVFSLFIFVFPEGVKEWWHTDQLSQMYIRGVPLEELLWAFSWGMCCGPFYEFFMGLKYQ